MTDISLTVSRKFNASPEVVFNAWLNPEMLRRFMLPGEGTSVTSAKTDPVEGGRFEIVMRAGDQDMPHKGTYTAISRHSQIAFTWETPFSETPSDVRLTFTPNGAGTELELYHTKFETEESRDNHKAGWGAILASLESVVS